jgi:hypothetical protein
MRPLRQKHQQGGHKEGVGGRRRGSRLCAEQTFRVADVDKWSDGCLQAGQRMFRSTGCFGRFTGGRLQGAA